MGRTARLLLVGAVTVMGVSAPGAGAVASSPSLADAGGITVSTPLGDQPAIAEAMNERGQIMVWKLSASHAPQQGGILDGTSFTPVTTTLNSAVWSPQRTFLNEAGDAAVTLTYQPARPGYHVPYLWSGGRMVGLGAATSTRAVGLTDDGRVVLQAQSGAAQPSGRPWVWSAGRRVSAPVPPGPSGTVFEADAVGPTGLVAGKLRVPGPYDPATPYPQATWTPGGAITPMEGVTFWGDVRAVTRSGFAALDGDEFPSHVHLWRADTGMVDVAPPAPTADEPRPGVKLAYNGVNDAGHLVVRTATRVLLWRDGAYTELASGTAGSVYAMDVDNHDRVILDRGGSSEAGSTHDALLWQDGTVIDLDAIAGGQHNTVPDFINDDGRIVGHRHLRDGTNTLLIWTLPSA